jgi:hypothetical protein
VKSRFPYPGGSPLKTAFGSYIDLATDYRLDPGFFRLTVKFDGPKEVPVIGDSQSRHLIFPGLIDKGRQAAGSIKETVFGMIMKMNKGGMNHFPIPTP